MGSPPSEGLEQTLVTSMQIPKSLTGPVALPLRSAAGLPSAGMWRRLFATLADMVVFLALVGLLALPALTSINWQSATASYQALVSTVTAPERLRHASALLGVVLGLWWGYFAVGWGLLGATPGKWLAGTRVVDHCDRYPIGLSRATMRLVAYSISSVTFCCGHAAMLLRSDRLALHDILAGTRVVCIRRSRRAHPPDQSAADEWAPATPIDEV